MPKRNNNNNDSDEEKHEIVLTFDIWSNILLFFDDFPPIFVNTDPFKVSIDKPDVILSIDKLMDLSLVCKEFKNIIESNHLFSKWKTIFMYNIFSKLETWCSMDKFDYDNYQFKKLLKNIVITNHKMIIKMNYICKRCNICTISYYHYELALFFPFFGISQYDNEENKNIVIKYEEDVKNIKTYIETLKETLYLIK